MDKSPNIIFFGTPDFAVPALNAMYRSRFNVSMVVTQPDRPKGRGRKMLPSPVKIAAKNLGYNLHYLMHTQWVAHTPVALKYE